MFETIKEFEDYIFSIETEAQLLNAKYGEADILAYFESLGEAVRIQVFKDLAIKSGKETVLNKKYDFQEMFKGFMENLDNLDSYFASIGEQHLPEIQRSQLEKYPLIRTILSNKMYNEEAETAQNSLLNEISLAPGLVSKGDAEKIINKAEMKPQNKGWFNSIKEAFIRIFFRKEAQYDEIPPEERLKGKETIEELNPEPITKEYSPEIESVISSDWFHKAIEKKFIMGETGKYEWNGTKRELTLFAELMSEKLKIKHKWKTFEVLFNQKNLAQAKDKVSGNFGSGSFGEREAEINEIFL